MRSSVWEVQAGGGVAVAVVVGHDGSGRNVGGVGRRVLDVCWCRFDGFLVLCCAVLHASTEGWSGGRRSGRWLVY